MLRVQLLRPPASAVRPERAVLPAWRPFPACQPAVFLAVYTSPLGSAAGSESDAVPYQQHVTVHRPRPSLLPGTALFTPPWFIGIFAANSPAAHTAVYAQL